MSEGREVERKGCKEEGRGEREGGKGKRIQKVFPKRSAQNLLVGNMFKAPTMFPIKEKENNEEKEKTESWWIEYSRWKATDLGTLSNCVSGQH